MNQCERLESPVREGAFAGGWKNVLVPLDGSEISKCVMAQARLILQQPGIFVTLLRVIECKEERAKDLMYRIDSRHVGARDALAEFRDELADRSVPVKAKLRFGDPATEILREVEEGCYDLVVMSTLGRAWLSRVLLESVAQKLIREAGVPILVFCNRRDRRPLSAPVVERRPVLVE